MPFEVRLFIKTGIVYMLLTFFAGAILLAAEGLGHPAPFVIGVEHGHAGFVGWLVNVVMGVALWMFPLARETFPETAGRYPPRAAFACWGCLNVGLAMRLLIEPWYQLGGQSAVAGAALVASAALQALGVAIFAAIVWHRIRPPSRPAPGVG
jgi:hypothetical protein